MLFVRDIESKKYVCEKAQKIVDIISAKENMPIVIICKEGSMEQIRLAAGYDCVKDILFAPIEPQQLKRRIAAYGSKISD